MISPSESSGMFCKRCASLLKRAIVADKKSVAYCHVCHREISDWFVDENGKFLAFGNAQFFEQLVAEFEKETAGLSHDLVRDRTMFAFATRNRSVKYAMKHKDSKFVDDMKLTTLKTQLEKEKMTIVNFRNGDEDAGYVSKADAEKRQSVRRDKEGNTERESWEFR